MIKDFGKYVARTNKKFNLASPEQKRVMIAKDSLARIKQTILIPLTGSFLKTGYLPNTNESFKDLLNGGNECVVCAKGALFCSIIGRVNEVTVNEIRTRHTSNLSFNDLNHRKLLEYFSKEQIDLIEIAFEGVSYLHVVDFNQKSKAQRFNEKYHVSSEKRLIEILKNIIKNDGTFIPE